MKTATLVLAIAVALSGCVAERQVYSDIRPTERQRDILERQWNQYYAGCMRDTLRRPQVYVSHGITTDSDKEMHCSCYANGVVDTLLQDMSPFYNGTVHMLELQSETNCFAREGR